MTPNPWNLSREECATLLCVAQYGFTKIVADKMKVGYKTIEARLSSAKKKMRMQHRIPMVLAFVEFAKAQEVRA